MSTSILNGKFGWHIITSTIIPLLLGLMVVVIQNYDKGVVNMVLIWRGLSTVNNSPLFSYWQCFSLELGRQGRKKGIGKTLQESPPEIYHSLENISFMMGIVLRDFGIP